MVIRAEDAADVDAISTVIARAFASQPHSNGSEKFIVDALRRANALTLSLVALEADEVKGHIAFSPVSVTDGSANWYGLGPLAVDPACQATGFGSALVVAGLATLRELGAAGCVVLGEPAYYERFGFRHTEALRYPGPPPQYFMALSLGGPIPGGEVSYHAAFSEEIA